MQNHPKEIFPGANAAGRLPARGMYDPANEHDACGVGFVARIDNNPTHQLVADAAKVLVNLEHRGAVGGDKSTGDGAGLLMNIPDAFFRAELKTKGVELPRRGNYGVGMVFLPTDAGLREKVEQTIEKTIESEGCEVLGWRDVPVDPSELGHLALSSMPHFRQIFVQPGEKIAHKRFELSLYVIRRMIEKEVASWDDADYSQFYMVSLSSRTVNYKGMLTGTQLMTFYPDLADTRFAASFAVVHQRYSTNTLPTWDLAQPFRYLAHNGEINTLRGNINNMRAREAQFASEIFGGDMDKIKPVLIENGSDSAIFDNAYELLTAAGRSAPHAMMMMIPEAWGEKYLMGPDRRAFYEYHSSMMEPWDGPASIAFTDGHRYIGAVLDRNGLRPSRFTITRDGMVVMASESGVLDIEPDNILQRGRLQPGKMFLLDLEQNRVVADSELKGKIVRQKPYRHWVRNNRIELRGLQAPATTVETDAEELVRSQHAFGFTEEELKMILGPMATNGQEATGSMGNDASLAVLSDRPQLLFSYFKQLFAQVTNPPIDPLRETLVMSLMTWLGKKRNLLTETPEHCRRLKIHHPVLTNEDLNRIENADHPDLKVCGLPMVFSAGGEGKALEKALDDIFKKAEEAITVGASILVLSDRMVDKDNAAIPSLLATAGLHHHLIRKGIRSEADIIVDSGEAREIMHFALLIGYGASAICPRVAFKTIQQMSDSGFLNDGLKAVDAMDNYITAIKKGLLKTFSRMGISTVRSYFAAQIFEAVGLASDFVEKYFTNTASRIEGIGLDEVARESVMRHERGFPKGDAAPSILLDMGGQYHIRKGGENHMWNPETIYKLQHATRTESYDVFKEYTSLADDASRMMCTPRSLFNIKKEGRKPIPIEEVEPIEKITPRFTTAAMSFGSISKEAHESIAIALNRLGGRSNSGEGGEDPVRFKPLPNGDLKRSAIKQVASGRFGVTIEYLNNADELQIKMAQGAKPGEGGQLPGHKVSEAIAKVRHTTPGVTLISPPPHHDIYSIEDLAQLIFDLKMSNPSANVSVKLVSEVGVGTVASGVAKAKSDLVLISGHDGGTGASPQTSIKYAGLPWELGLAETQQSLVQNHLRDRITVQTDGQLKTGRDLAIAALLGAEEYGFGTSILITLGCVMMRKCHLNTCPVGVATQDERLRCRFTGKPEYVVNFLRFLAQEMREYMAELGFRTVDEMIGRMDLLEMKEGIDHWKAKNLNFDNLFTMPEDTDKLPIRRINKQEHAVMEQLDQKIIPKVRNAIENKEHVSVDMPIRNIHRTIGTTLSSEIAKRYGNEGLPEDTIELNLRGSAGQSLGAFLAHGVTIRVEGDANDYVGKGLSGGKIIVVPPKDASFVPHENIIAGNVILYGATGGQVYLRGMAGERFAIRNSGASAVVEGVGDHGCEYMTGGTVVCIGSTGNNFAAGMSGGVAYVYDPTELFETRCNLDMVDLESVWNKEDESRLRELLENHYRYTNSTVAREILENWESRFPRFVKVMPIEYRKVLERMKQKEHAEDESVSATEEVYSG
ncbi:MAG: glutamate synthase large subunit [Candidatus Sumerlaeota bacterium]